MMIKSKFTSLLSLGIACAGFTLVSGNAVSVAAQARDPFAKPGYAKPRPTSSGVTSTGQPRAAKPKPAGPLPVSPNAAPPIESRIAYYKNLREAAATNGMELPKVTSVLTLDEMAVTGIFRTPRGYAAMVEAKPIKLSYTIYPGEKFFDGQLVAIEENRLVFRKITKLSNNKFITAVENKTLRQFTVEQEVQGTAPIQSGDKKEEQAANTVLVPKDSQTATTPPPSMIVSPLDEMNRQPKEEPAKTGKEKPAKNSKKSVKVAKSKKSDDQK
ncbi:MAG: hypothetical protein LH472_08325 [Pyrinomonadaceae bacterium]|nr:hypothetical protein [Pyrinomonadaceae bacterium]